MIVIGADTHKATHTCAAVDGGSGQLAGGLTATARKAGFMELLAWSRGLDPERVWAIEDCRHVSGALERFLVAAGERVVRIPPRLTGESRRGERSAGESDPIDALAVARAALREGPETLPVAHLDVGALRIKLLLDHREDIVKARSADQQRLRWHLHDLWPELEIPTGGLDRAVWLDRLARKLARAEQGARVRIARELVIEIRRRVRGAGELEAEIAALVEKRAPQLLELKGCGVLTAAKLVAETAGATRFASDAKFARLAGVAPVPASLRQAHPLPPRPRRQPPAELRPAPHRRLSGPGASTGAGVPRAKAGRGKSRREALRCLKRHLARRVWKLLIDSEVDQSPSNPVDPQRGSATLRIAAVA